MGLAVSFLLFESSTRGAFCSLAQVKNLPLNGWLGISKVLALGSHQNVNSFGETRAKSFSTLQPRSILSL